MGAPDRSFELSGTSHHPDGILCRYTGGSALGGENDSLHPGGAERAWDPRQEVVYEQSDALIRWR